MRKIITVVFVSAILGCLLNKSVEAQNPSCKTPPITYCIGMGPCEVLATLPTIKTCFSDFITTCSWATNDRGCAPNAAPTEAGCGGGAGGGGPHSCAGKPINLATGNTFISQTDIGLSGLGGGMTLTRTWNSIWPATEMGAVNFMFGPNWTATYQEKVFSGSDGYLKYARSDGSFWSFGVANNASPWVYGPVAPASAGVTITQGTSSWTLIFKNGEQRLFDSTTGNLTSIIDRNGNTTLLTYDTNNRLNTVTDPVGRHLNFTYVDGIHFLVSSVSSDVGITYSYTYDTQGRLAQVTKPDNTTVSFQYDTNFNITAVLDSNGKVLESHTYDLAHRSLTSSRANGVEAITVTYPQ